MEGREIVLCPGRKRKVSPLCLLTVTCMCSFHVCLYVCLYFCRLFVCRYMSVCLFVTYVCSVRVCSSVFLSVVCLYITQYQCVSVCPCLTYSAPCMPVHLFIFLYVFLSCVSMSVYVRLSVTFASHPCSSASDVCYVPVQCSSVWLAVCLSIVFVCSSVSIVCLHLSVCPSVCLSHSCLMLACLLSIFPSSVCMPDCVCLSHSCSSATYVTVHDYCNVHESC